MIVERYLSWIDSAPLEKRVEAATALADAYLQTGLGEGDLETADAIVMTLLDDPSPRVRLALAAAFGASPAAPRHVMATLAADLPDIATLVLARSPVFLDAELIDLVTKGASHQRLAIACRDDVCAAVAAAIAEKGEREACLGLVANDGAKLPPDALHCIALRFGSDAEMRRALFKHPETRPRTRVALIGKLAEAIRDEAVARASVPAARVEELARESFDKAVVAYAASASEADLAEIAETLVEQERMTTALLLRAICLGHITLFASAVARLAQVPVSRVEAVLADDRRTVLRALYRKAELPEFAFGVFADAIDSWRDLLSACEPREVEKLPYLVTRKVCAAYQGAADARLDGLLVLLRKLAAEAARDRARREVGRIAAGMDRREVLALAAPRPDAESRPAADNAEAIDIAPEVISAFALYFAEEIVDLEEQLAEAASDGAGETEPRLSDEDIEIALRSLDIDDIDPPMGIANDDRPDGHAQDASVSGMAA